MKVMLDFVDFRIPHCLTAVLSFGFVRGRQSGTGNEVSAITEKFFSLILTYLWIVVEKGRGFIQCLRIA